MSKIKDFLIISRGNIQIGTIPHGLLGLFLSITHFLQFNLFYWLYFVLYMVSITFACNINCYFDVDVDKMYKKGLYEATMNIGKRNIKMIMLIELFIIISILSMFLIFGFYITSIFIIMGIILSILYSAKPFRIKAKGFWSPFPVLFGLYMFPVLGGYFISNNFMNFIPLLLFVIGYGFFNEGITLVNTCEDYAEDKEVGIRTWAHVFGLQATLKLAFIFTLLGTLLANISLIIILVTKNFFSIFYYITLIFIIFSILLSLKTSKDIFRVTKESDLELASKRNAPNMPKWFITTRYPLLIICILLIFF
ncbi:MAG: prenyltransferase [Candidatus Helarchaeota archaeon]